MKYFIGLEDLNTKDCALESLELFGSTNRKLDLPLGVECDSHQPDKVSYVIPFSNDHAKRACMEEALNDVDHGLAHTTSVLETCCIAS